MANPCDEGRKGGLGRVAEAGERGWEKRRGKTFDIPQVYISRIDLEDRAIGRPEQGSF